MTKKNIKKATGKPQATKNIAQSKKRSAIRSQSLIDEQAVAIEEQSIEAVAPEHVKAIENTADYQQTDQTEVIESEVVSNTEMEPVIETAEDKTIQEVIVTAKPIKQKRKDITYEKLVGCSYHFFRKYFRKLFNDSAIPVRFQKHEIGYNGHMEVSAPDKKQAMMIVENFKTENPSIKNLYWEI